MVLLVKGIFSLYSSGKLKLFCLLMLFLLLSLLELVGIGMLIPIFNNLINNPMLEATGNSTVLTWLLIWLQDLSIEVLLLLAILGFGTRMVMMLAVIGFISVFVNTERRIAGINSMQRYFDRSYQTHLDSSAAESVYQTQTLTTHLMSAMQSLLKLIGDMVVASALLLFLFLAEPIVFGALVVFFGLVLGTIFYSTRNQLFNLGREINRAETRIVSVSQDVSKIFKEIKLLGRAEFMIGLLNKEFHKVQRATISLHLISALPRLSLELALLIFFFTAWMVALRFGVDKQQIIVVAITYALVGLRLLPVVSNISAQLARLTSLQDSVFRLVEHQRNKKPCDDELKLLTPPQGVPDAVKINSPLKLLSLNEVCFQYPSAKKPTFEQINFSIQQGQVVGILGLSGVGKTTLLNVLAGLLPITSGSFSVNGHRLESSLHVREYIGYVPQESSIIEGSLLENITMSDDDGKDIRERVESICRKMSLDDVVNVLPRGIDATLGQNALKISGGQRQRIAIARALYHKRPLLIFDEATNALDELSEGKIIQNIRTDSGFGSLIVVSHRMSTLDHCDQVYRLDPTGLSEVKKNEYIHKFKKNDISGNKPS